MISWLVQEKNIGGTHKLPGETKSSALATAQLFEWLSASSLGVEAESLQNSIYTGSEGIATFAIEPLEVAVVSCQHLRRGRLASLCQMIGLFGEGVFQSQKIGELSGTGFPHGSGFLEVTVLLEKRKAKTGLTRDCSLRRLLCTGDQAKERRF